MTDVMVQDDTVILNKTTPHFPLLPILPTQNVSGM